MLIQCVSVISVLGVVLMGMLIMTQVVSLDAALRGIGRGLLLILAAAMLLCILKPLAMAAIEIAILWVRRLIVWLAIIALAIVGVVVVSRIALSKLENRLPEKGGHPRGDL